MANSGNNIEPSLILYNIFDHPESMSSTFSSTFLRQGPFQNNCFKQQVENFKII